jgi:hypothetical protein
MSTALFFLLVILTLIGVLFVKGSKAARAAAAYVIWYSVARILDDRLFNGGVSGFVRSAIQAVINAFQGIFNPNDIGALLISAAIIALLVWLLLKASPAIKNVIVFALVYVVLRFIEVAIFGSGFSSFMRDVFLNISAAFANGAASI